MLTSLECGWGYIYFISQSLGRQETQALVQAMESGMGDVALLREVTLDIEAFTEYSGQGVCKKVVLKKDVVARYRGELRTWARSRNWRVAVDEDWLFCIRSN